MHATFNVDTDYAEMKNIHSSKVEGRKNEDIYTYF